MKRIIARFVSMCWFFIAIFFLLFPRRAQNGGVKKLVIIQMAKLGDMVCTTPMFRAFKTAYPDGVLLVMGNSINREILRGNPYVNEYLVSSGRILETARILASVRADSVCITGPGFEQLVTAVLARIPLIIIPRIRNGFSPYESFWYKVLSRFVCVRDHRMQEYAPREYLRLLEPLGIHTDDTRKEIYFTPAAKETVDALYRTHPLSHGDMRIGILPGAGNDIKSWAPEKFAELMRIIAQSHPRAVFVLLGAQKDAERAAVIHERTSGQVTIIDCIGALSLDELKACIATLSLVIGADTGPQYIAEALDIPTIDIVGPCDEREQPPMGEIHLIVKVEREKPELYVMNARRYDPIEAQRQTDDITPEMVYDSFLKLWMIIKK